jgi:hypothetical protein
MSTPLLRPATVDDIKYVACNIRKPDAKEIWARSRRETEDALLSVFGQQPIFAVEHKGRVVCVCGYLDYEETKTRFIWMIGTKCLDKYKLTFVRSFRKVLKDWKPDGWTLSNKVWIENTKQVKLLQSCGATFGPVYKGFSYFSI